MGSVDRVDTSEGEGGPPSGPVPGTAGILLTGGLSRRMGSDKASLRIDGQVSAQRLGTLLSAVSVPAIEVGACRSPLPSVREVEAGGGPLVALAAGWAVLGGLGHSGPVLVLACDLPLVDEALVRLLATWPAGTSVVPVVEGRPQPLCARFSSQTLSAAPSLVAEGHRSLRSLLEVGPVLWLEEPQWGPVASRRSFTDVDRPDDLDALGLAWSRT